MPLNDEFIYSFSHGSSAKTLNFENVDRNETGGYDYLNDTNWA